MSRGAGRRGLDREGNYAAGERVGIQPYGVSPTESHRAPYLVHVRGGALDKAKKIYASLGIPYVGLRATPWGGEIVSFGQRAGLQRWANEQTADTDVWYAVAFDLSMSSTPFMEVAR